PVLAALAHWGARLLGPPDANAHLHEGWLAGALWTAVVGLAPEARIAFRVAGEEASLDAGTVVGGVTDDAEALVEGDATGFYHLVVDGAMDGLAIEGDRDAVVRLTSALARAGAPALA
ncbi:MAG: hypothetical protein ABI927_04550, partial [Gaiellaceae bacterium]